MYIMLCKRGTNTLPHRRWAAAGTLGRSIRMLLFSGILWVWGWSGLGWARLVTGLVAMHHYHLTSLRASGDDEPFSWEWVTALGQVWYIQEADKHDFFGFLEFCSSALTVSSPSRKLLRSILLVTGLRKKSFSIQVMIREFLVRFSLSHSNEKGWNSWIETLKCPVTQVVIRRIKTIQL